MFWPLALPFLCLLLRSFGFLIVFSTFRPFLSLTVVVLLSMVTALLCYPLAATAGSEVPVFMSFELWLLLFGELLIGALLGLPVALSVEAFSTAGRVSDVARGAQFGEQILPGAVSKVSPLESLAIIIVLMLVFSSGAYQLFFLALEDSLVLLPLASGLPLAALTAENLSAIVLGFVRIAASAINVGVLFAAPLIIGLFVLDLGAAIATRQLGRMNVTFEFLPLRLLLGLLIAAGTLSYAPFDWREVIQSGWDSSRNVAERINAVGA